MSADLLAAQFLAMGLPQSVREFRFAADAVGGPGKGLRKRLQAAGLRDWRFDFAWPSLMFAVEYEGASAAGGRHQRFGGFLADLDKYHHAQRLGWTVYRTSHRLVQSGEAVTLISEMIAEMPNRGWR